MKKKYITPAAAVCITRLASGILDTSRYTGETDYEKVKKDDDDDEPTAKSKFNNFDFWD